jgi:predicted metal-dependent phosphoesterase TrpH
MRQLDSDLTDYLVTDFHTHTIYSPDSLTTPHQLIAAARRKRIDRVVVTDHNEIEGAIRAKELDPETIIIGSEIETPEGEILAAFMTEGIPSGLPSLEVIRRLKEQNAFISISHPFDPYRKGGWRVEALLEILPYIDAIETFNARCIWPNFNWQAEKFAQKYKLLGTHGSDAHTAFEIGRGSLLVPRFEDSTSLKENLTHAISPRLTLSAPWVHIASRYASWIKKNRNQPR